jgi:hypothetical protein
VDQLHRFFFTVVDPSGSSRRTVFESQPPRPVVSTSRLSITGRSRRSTLTSGTGAETHNGGAIDDNSILSRRERRTTDHDARATVFIIFSFT